MNKKNQPRGSRRAEVLRMLLTVAVTYVITTALLLIGMTPEQYDIKVGYPASIDILATKNVTDTVTTEANRKRAADQVEESYRGVDDTVAASVTADLTERFAELQLLREEEDAVSPDESTDGQLEALSEALPVSITREQYEALMKED